MDIINTFLQSSIHEQIATVALSAAFVAWFYCAVTGKLDDV